MQGCTAGLQYLYNYTETRFNRRGIVAPLCYKGSQRAHKQKVITRLFININKPAENQMPQRRKTFLQIATVVIMYFIDD